MDSFSLTRRCVVFTQCTRRAIRPRSPLWPILITPTQLQIIKQPVTRVSISEEPSQTTRQRLVLNDCYHEISTILLTIFFLSPGLLSDHCVDPSCAWWQRPWPSAGNVCEEKWRDHLQRRLWVNRQDPLPKSGRTRRHKVCAMSRYWSTTKCLNCGFFKIALERNARVSDWGALISTSLPTPVQTIDHDHTWPLGRDRDGGSDSAFKSESLQLRCQSRAWQSNGRLKRPSAHRNHSTFCQCITR